MIFGILPQFLPVLLSRPRWTIILGLLLAICPGNVLTILSNGGKGDDYWKYMVSLISLHALIGFLANRL